MIVGLSRPGRMAAQVVLTFFAVLFAAPLIVTILVSLEGRGAGNYLVALEFPLFFRFFLNSAIVAGSTVALVAAITTLAAYAFAKLELRGRNVLFYAVIVGLVVPGIALTLPIFMTVRHLGLLNNYLAVILPQTALAIPFSLLLMRNYLDGLPDELLQAAQIDGANSLQTLWWIVVPLSRPILAVVVIWTFLHSWNEYFFGLLFMRDESMRLIAQMPSFFVDEFGGQDSGLIFATMVLISLPVITLYMRSQRQFEAGLLGGAGR